LARLREKGCMGVNAQKFGRFWALRIRGSLWGDGSCVFAIAEMTGELLALGVLALEVRRNWCLVVW
jgi:hypothetical protein